MADTRVPSGTYEFLVIRKGKTVAEPLAPPNSPPGSIMHFYVQGVRCAMLDMMVGFQGFVVRHGSKVEITWLEGPSGKLPKRDVLAFTASTDMKELTSETSPEGDKMVFRWQAASVPLTLPY